MKFIKSIRENFLFLGFTQTNQTDIQFWVKNTGTLVAKQAWNTNPEFSSADMYDLYDFLPQNP